MVKPLKPKKLSEGSLIGIVSPAGVPDEQKALKAGGRLEEMGYRIHYGQSLQRENRYLAGTDKERAEEINRLFGDDRIDAVFCTRGGYGSPRIAPYLDYELIRTHPKIFWGYSDITYLHTAIHQKADMITFHGPMLSSDLGDDTVHPFDLDAIDGLKQPQPIVYSEKFSSHTVLKEGKAEGPLIGGNLTLLANSLGTPFEADTQGKLLFIEETEEEPYAIDRLLNQLKLAGKFDDAAGILLCDFNDCVPKKRTPSFSIEELAEHHILPSGKPVMMGIKAGHCTPNLVLPIGAQSILNTYNKSISIEDPLSS